MSFQWSDECEDRSQKLNTLLTSTPVLAYPKDFNIYCDASGVGSGGVLMKKDKLKTYERNYPTHDLELAVAMFVLKLWQHVWSL